MLSQVVWKNFIETGNLAIDLPPFILASWKRCKKIGVNPFKEKVELSVSPQELINYQKKSILYMSLNEEIKKNIKFLLVQNKAVITLANSDGLILYLDGDERGVKISHENGFVPGAYWLEDSAGNNTIATCLRLKKPVIIKNYEHYCKAWHRYDAASFPLFSFDKKLLGVITIACESEQNSNIEAVGRIIANIFERLIKEYELKDQLFWYKCLTEYFFSEIQRPGLIVDENKSIILANSSAQAFFGKKLLNLNELERYWNRKIDIDNNIKTLRFLVGKKEEIILTSKSFGEKKVLFFEKGLVKRKILSTNTGYSFNDLIGKSKSLQNAIAVAKKLANCDINILLEGETGTGKEMFASAIHHASNRSSAPFIAVNCGAIPRELIISELFGYEEGTFTGAKRHGNAGKFELANGGTLFLDEIGELPLDSQVILLRVLRNKEITRLGGHKVIPVDVRVIAATNRDLLAEVRKGHFRKDLYYRLNGVKIVLPPLRQRPEDILPLWEKFLQDACNQQNKDVPKTTSAVRKILLEYNWPGNIRELKNAAERVAVLAENTILPEHLPVLSWIWVDRLKLTGK
ncbi:MAG: sigma 54-interacting transcriptional regulator [Bacillota bacterium]